MEAKRGGMHVVLGAVAEDDPEHAAGEAADGVGGADFAADPPCDGREDLVADVEAVDLVDRVEIVDRRDDEGDALARLDRAA